MTRSFRDTLFLRFLSAFRDIKIMRRLCKKFDLGTDFFASIKWGIVSWINTQFAKPP